MNSSVILQLDFTSRLIIALLLVVAGFAKIKDPKLTAETIQNFGIVPKKISYGLGVFLSITEIIAGLGILIPGTIVFASVISTTLFFTFTFALIYAITTGKSIVCGCFGNFRRDRLNWLTAVRSGSLFIASLIIYLLNSNHGNLLISANILSTYLVITSALLSLTALVTSFGLFSLDDNVREELAINTSRRDFLKILGAFTLALATLPVKPTFASHCCHCQLYRHYDPFCCAPPGNSFFHIRHYYKRCCNSCTGQVGGWHKYQENGCQCECATPVGSCGDFIYPCTGSVCFTGECGPCHGG